jgi:outer membrane protein OmpA-like peptidoglycan-associated protein
LVRDAQARTVRAVGILPSEDARRDLEAAIARELPGYRLEAQVVTATGGPASLDVAIGLNGQVKRLESDIASLRLDTENRFKETEALVTSEADRLRARIDDVASGLPDARGFLHLTLSNYAMFFEEGTSYRSQAEAERALDAIATLLMETPGPRIRLIGHGDDLGPRAVNLRIGQARAEKVASDLVARGIDHTRLVLAAREGSREIVGDHGAGSANRRVIFDLAYVGE